MAAAEASVTKCWNKKQPKFPNNAQNLVTEVFTFKKIFFKIAQMSPKIWATFVKKCVA